MQKTNYQFDCEWSTIVFTHAWESDQFVLNPMQILKTLYFKGFAGFLIHHVSTVDGTKIFTFNCN